MKAVVVGGAGFVGSHLVDRLLADGHTVDVIDDLSTGSLTNLADARSGAGGSLKVHHLDLRSAGLAELLARREPAVVYHLAVLPAGLPLVVAAEVAVAGTLHVLDAVHSAGVPKVVVTLPAVAYYGAVAAREVPVKEGQLGAAASVATVLARTVTDILALFRETRGVEYTALALGEIYGSRQRPQDGVIAELIAARLTGQPARLAGDGRHTLDLVYIDDAVDALVRAAERGSGLVINIGTGQQTAVRELHDMICAPGPDAVSGPRPSSMPLRFALSPVRARIHLAWAPWTSLADGVTHTLADATARAAES